MRRAKLLVRWEAVGGLGLAAPLRLLYASDLHFGWAWTNGIVQGLTEIVHHARPDVLLLGGDLVDRAGGLAALGEVIEGASAVCPVFAVEGNHDRRFGVDRVRNVVESSGGTWLRSTIFGQVWLDARPAQRCDERPRVLVGHDPAVFEDAVRARTDVVFAGHLHGGQCVLLTRRNLLYPGAFFARYTGLRFDRDGTTMIVSRGAADTVPLRFGCPREVILCTLS